MRRSEFAFFAVVTTTRTVVLPTLSDEPRKSQWRKKKRGKQKDDKRQRFLIQDARRG
jgi:hypothetical protein